MKHSKLKINGLTIIRQNNVLTVCTLYMRECRQSRHYFTYTEQNSTKVYAPKKPYLRLALLIGVDIITAKRNMISHSNHEAKYTGNTTNLLSNATNSLHKATKFCYGQLSDKPFRRKTVLFFIQL